MAISLFTTMALFETDFVHKPECADWLKHTLHIFFSTFKSRYFKTVSSLKTFSAVFFAHPIAQVFLNLKTQGLRVRIALEA